MRSPQAEGHKGSLKWIQRAVGDRWDDLEGPILAANSNANAIEWLSPLGGDDFAEYRDTAFLELLELGHLSEALTDFWPKRGPQWDALARFDNGDILLVEAKAHIGEFCTPPTNASAKSLQKIQEAMTWTASQAGLEPESAVHWHRLFYQYTNRIAHLAFLRSQGVSAWLAMVGFVGDTDFPGDTTAAAWDAAYRVAHYAIGLPQRHRLAQYIVFVHPDTARSR